MILDPADPHRGRRGHHHDRHRSNGESPATGSVVRQCCVLVGDGTDGTLAAQAEHLAASLEAHLVTYLGLERDQRETSTPIVAEMEAWFHALAWHERDAFLRIARASDCVIVDKCLGRAAKELATLSGRPFLVVPPGVAPERIGMRALFFWDQRGCTAAALRDVMPFLRDASVISVVGEHAGVPASFLEKHGFSVDVVESDDVEDDRHPADFLAGHNPARIISWRADDAAMLVSPSW